MSWAPAAVDGDGRSVLFPVSPGDVSVRSLVVVVVVGVVALTGDG